MDAKDRLVVGLENANGGSSNRVSREESDGIHQAITDGRFEDAYEELGQTDCPEGCFVEPDGECPHGYESLGLRMGLI